MISQLIKISIELKIDLLIEERCTLQCLESHYTFLGLQIQEICSALSLNMSESKQSSTLHELEMSELPQGSPDEIAKSAPAPMQAGQSPWICNIKRCMFLIFLVISSTVLVAEINAAESSKADLPIVENGDFTFRVYCPYSSKARAQQLLRENQSGQLRRLYQRPSYTVQLPFSQDQTFKQYNFTNTYVIDMQSQSNNGTPQLFYCGYTRPFNQDCSQEVKYTCSSPGAMFDLDVSSYTDIIWINNISPQDAKISSCMTSPTSNNSRCQLMVKSIKTKTFDDPTMHQDDPHLIQIVPTQWPATAHIHGAEVRPTFDGNPLSWFSNSGARGVGAFSLNDTCYYECFDQNKGEERFEMPPNLIVKKDGNLENRIKVNRYPNIQNPGNLWYHDHAMRLTLYNVQYGLSGLYILRNKTIEQQIGIGINQEKLVMMTRNGWTYLQNLESEDGIVYRFRFLNNNFGGSNIYRVYFVYGDCKTAQSYINFTIIGADSSLFNEGICNQQSFIIGQAERIEILIKFSNARNYSICTSKDIDAEFPPKPKSRTESASLDDKYDDSLDISAIKIVSGMQFKSILPNTTRKNISDVKLDVPFTDFNNSTLPIAVKRMRPLIIFNNPFFFSINGRIDFHAGKSENPTIGTYEDWYLINTMDEAHPIHVHLINFQVVKILSLKRTTNDCTLYELDFMVEAMKDFKNFTDNTRYFPTGDTNSIDYNNVCEDKDSITSFPGFFKSLESVNVENVADKNGISGIDVEKIVEDTNEAQRLTKQGFPTKVGDRKYVTNQVNAIKPYYRRWKDTALVEAYKVFVYRIRWTKSSYAGPGDTPFHVPVDQLRQYPGFVYHCHILFHEDQEMMRPIMLQLPTNAKLNSSTPCNNNPSNTTWAAKAVCINDHCKDPK